MDKQLLKSYIVRHGDRQKDLADAMGLSISRLNAKINEHVDKKGNRAEFTETELKFIKNRYRLDDSEFVAIFFAPELS